MDTLTLADGTRLQCHAWPAGGASRGRVLIVHGLGEHGGRYGHVAAALNAADWDVSCYDQRGHGRSDGKRGAAPTDAAPFEDLAAIIDALPASTGPLILLGHSMGGLIAARFVAEALAPRPAPWSRPVDALVLSSPALALGMNPLQQLLLAVLGPLAPDLAIGNGLKPEWVSRDAAVVRAYIDDPLVHDRVTPRLVRMMVDGGAAVLARAPQWRQPTLLMWAGADRCVAPSGSADFAAAAPPTCVETRAWPALSHEIFNEPEQQQVLAHLCQWLDRLPAPPPPRTPA